MNLQSPAEINDRQIKELKIHVNVSWLKMGQLLYECQKNKHYLKHGCDTFETYIAQPELAFKRASVYSLIGIYKDFILTHHLPMSDIGDIDQKKLEMIRPQLKSGNVEDLLAKARTLSRSDLYAELTPQHECQPVQITQCSICHKRLE